MTVCYVKYIAIYRIIFLYISGCSGRDCMIVGFTTTCAISAYHH